LLLGGFAKAGDGRGRGAVSRKRGMGVDGTRFRESGGGAWTTGGAALALAVVGVTVVPCTGVQRRRGDEALSAAEVGGDVGRS
jgi:hypothetical protein